MSHTYIPAALRRLVAERAQYRCEYCGIHEADTAFGCQVDHIIAEKHRGRTDEANLAYACGFCNQNKGSDIASILSPDAPEIIRFFHPRRDLWEDHFYLNDDFVIEGISDIGRVTAEIFGFNQPDRVAERRLL